MTDCVQKSICDSPLYPIVVKFQAELMLFSVISLYKMISNWKQQKSYKAFDYYFDANQR